MTGALLTAGLRALVDPVSEDVLKNAVSVLVRLVEAGGAVVIFLGALLSFVRFVVVGLRTRRSSTFVRVRLVLGRFLALGLEFQLAGDILRTAVAPSFDELGKLAAIAAIRTGLNYFLSRELREERREVARGDGPTV